MYTNSLFKKLFILLLSVAVSLQTFATGYAVVPQRGVRVATEDVIGKRNEAPSPINARPLVIRTQSSTPSTVEIDADKFDAIAGDLTPQGRIVMTATVRDANGMPVPSTNLMWRIDGAVLVNPQPVLTNEFGQASVQLSSAEALTTIVKLVVNSQFEFDTGRIITFSKPIFRQVYSDGLIVSSDQILQDDILVTGTLEITGAAVVTLVGQRLIQATNIVIGPQARLSADGTGHGEGRGASPGWPKQESATGGGGHGGHGGQGSLFPPDEDPAWPGAPYGSIGQPERLGSSGGVRAGNLACPGRGGGAIRLIATQAITLDGTISANGANAQTGSACGGGAGGSIWLSAVRYAGSGTIMANGGDGDVTTYNGVELRGGGGGGGRVALHGLTAQPPDYIIQVAPGANGLWAAESGTVIYISPIDQSSSGLSLARDILYADGNHTTVITVTLTGNDGAPVVGRSILMKVSPAIEGIWLDNQEAGWWNQGEVNVGPTDDQGQRVVAIKANQVGVFSVTARTADGVGLSPTLQLAFVPGPVASVNWSAVPSLTVAVGRTITLSGELQDAQSRPISNHVVSLSSPLSDLWINPRVVTSSSEGRFSVVLTSSIAGQYSLNISISSLDGDLFTDVVSVTFVALSADLDLDASELALEGGASSTGWNGQSSIPLQVRLLDTQNSPLAGWTITPFVIGSSEGIQFSPPISGYTTDENGLANFRVSALRSESSYTVTVGARAVRPSTGEVYTLAQQISLTFVSGYVSHVNWAGVTNAVEISTLLPITLSLSGPDGSLVLNRAVSLRCAEVFGSDYTCQTLGVVVTPTVRYPDQTGQIQVSFSTGNLLITQPVTARMCAEIQPPQGFEAATHLVQSGFCRDIGILPSPVQISATVSSNIFYLGQSITYSVNLKNKNGLPLPSQKITITVPAPGKILKKHHSSWVEWVHQVVLTTTDSGVVSATIAADAAGPITLTARSAAGAIVTSTASAVPGPVDRIVFEVPYRPELATGESTLPATITVYAFNHYIPGRVVIIDPGNTLTVSPTIGNTNYLGRVYARLGANQVVTTASLTITVSPGPLGDTLTRSVSAQFLFVVPSINGVSLTSSTITSSLTNLYANDTSTRIEVQVLDVSGLPAPRRPVDIIVEPNPATGSGHWRITGALSRADGTAEYLFGHTIPGTYIIRGLIHEVGYSAPITIPQLLTVTLLPGPAQASLSRLHAHGPAFVGERGVTVTLVLTDVQGRRVRGAPARLRVIDSSVIITPSATSTNENGEALFVVRRNNPGYVIVYGDFKQPLDLQGNWQSLPQSLELTFSYPVVDPQQSLMWSESGHPLVPANGQTAIMITVSLRDSAGYLVRQDRPVVFKLSASAPVTMSAPGGLVTATNGVANITLRSSVPQTVVVSAWLPDQGITLTQRVTVTFVAVNTDPALSTIEADRPVGFASLDRPLLVTVTLRDSQGQLVPLNEVSLIVSGTNTQVQPQFGQVWRVGTSQPQTITLRAVDTTIGVTLSQVLTVSFVPGPISGLSQRGMWPTQVAADGYQTSVVSATLLDSAGRPLVGYPVQLMASPLGDSSSAGLFVSPSFTQFSDENGYVSFYLSATQPGRWYVQLFDLRNQSLGYSSLSLPLLYLYFFGSPDPVATILESSKSLALAYGREAITLTLRLRDRTGQSVLGVPISFTTNAQGVTLTQISTDSNPVQAIVKKHTPGSVTVSALLPNGQIIKQTVVTFYAPSLWAPYSQITISNPSAVANGVDRIAIRAVLRGVDGNSVSNRLVRLIASGGQVTFPDGQARATDNQGEVSFTIASTKSGYVSLLIEDTLSGDTMLAGSVVFRPSIVDAGRSQVLVDNTFDIGKAKLTVILRDSQDNPVPNQSIRIESNRPISISTTGTANESGMLFAIISSNTVPTASLSIFAGDIFLGNYVVFLGGMSSTSLSRLTPSSPMVTADGESALVLTAELRTESGAPMVNMPVRLEIVSSQAGIDYAYLISPSHQQRTDLSGNARFFVRAARAGVVEFVLKDDLHRSIVIARTVITFTAGTVHPSASNFLIENGDTHLVQEWLESRVVLRDRYDNPVAGQPVSIQVEGQNLQFAGQQVQPIDSRYVLTATTSQEGAAHFLVSSPSSQIITLTAWHSGRQIGRVLNAVFLSRPDLNRSTLVIGAPGQAVADGQAAISVAMRLLDANGGPIVGLPIEVLLKAPRNAYSISPAPVIATGADGQAQFFVSSIRAGIFNLEVRSNVDGMPIASGTLTFTANALSLSASKLDISPSFPQPADGTTPYKVTVTALDDNDNPLQGVSVEVQTVPREGVTVTQPQGTTDANGRAVAYLVSTSRAPISITARVDGHLINAMANVRFHGANLRVLSALVRPLYVGNQAFYIIEVVNNGELTGQQASLEVLLDPKLSFVDQSSALPFSRTERLLRWSLGDLGSGDRRWVRLVLDGAQAKLGDTVFVTSSVSALNGDEDDSDNTTVTSAVVMPQRDFEVALQEPIQFIGGGEGSIAVYTLIITNTGISTDVFTVSARLKSAHDNFGLISFTVPTDNFSVTVRPGQSGALPVILHINGCERQGQHSFEVVVSSSDGRVKQADGSLILSSQPDLLDLHPSNGFVAAGGEAVFTWVTHGADAQGMVVIERSDGPGVGGAYSSTVRRIENGLLRHTVVVSNLLEDASYRWRAQLVGACARTESAPLLMRMERAVTLTGPTRAEIERNYNQSVAFVLSNRASAPRLVSVTAEALNGAQEFILGFVGSGSQDQAVVLPPGAFRTITLSLHAQHTTSSDYQVLLKVNSRSPDAPDAWTQFNALLDVHVRQPVISYTVSESYDPATMIRTYTITNHADPLTDLRLSVDSDLEQVHLFTNPTVDHVNLGTGETITVQIIPQIMTDVVTAAASLAANLTGLVKITAANGRLQESRVLETPPPPQQGVTLHKGRVPNALIEAVSRDEYCTNNPNIALYLYTPYNYQFSFDSDDHRLELSFLPQSDARPHNVNVYLNRNLVFSRIDEVPSGKYVEKVSPQFISPHGVQQVDIKTRHLNGGHYVVATGARLVACSNAYEQWVYASSQAEADDIVRRLRFVKPGFDTTGQLVISEPARGQEITSGSRITVTALVNGSSLPPGAGVYLLAKGAGLYQEVRMDRVADNAYVAVVGPAEKVGPLFLEVSAETCGYEPDRTIVAVVSQPEEGEGGVEEETEERRRVERARGSYFQVHPPVVIPDGRSKATITLTLRTLDNVIIPDAEVWLYNEPAAWQFNAPAPGEVLSVTGRTNAQGQFTAVLTSTVPDYFFIKAKDLSYGTPIDAVAIVRFGLPGSLEAKPKTARPNGKDVITITVKTSLRDTRGVSGTVVRLFTEGGSVGHITPQVVRLNSAGAAQAFITSTQPGQATIYAVATITRNDGTPVEMNFARPRTVHFIGREPDLHLSLMPRFAYISETVVLTLSYSSNIPTITFAITTSRPFADRLSVTSAEISRNRPITILLTSSLPGESEIIVDYFDSNNEMTRTLTNAPMVTFFSPLQVLSLTVSPTPTIYFVGQPVSITGFVTGSHLYSRSLLLAFGVKPPELSSTPILSPEQVYPQRLYVVHLTDTIQPDGRFTINFHFDSLPIPGYLAVGGLYDVLPSHSVYVPSRPRILRLLGGQPDIIVTDRRPTIIESIVSSPNTTTEKIASVASDRARIVFANQPVTITARSLIGVAPYTFTPSVGLPVAFALKHHRTGLQNSLSLSSTLLTDESGRITATLVPSQVGPSYLQVRHLVTLSERARGRNADLLAADRVYVVPPDSNCVEAPAILEYQSNYKFGNEVYYPYSSLSSNDKAFFRLTVNWNQCRPGKAIVGVVSNHVSPEDIMLNPQGVSHFYREHLLPDMPNTAQIVITDTFDPFKFAPGGYYVYVMLISRDDVPSNLLLQGFTSLEFDPFLIGQLILFSRGVIDPAVTARLTRLFFLDPLYAVTRFVQHPITKRPVPGVLFAPIFPHPKDEVVSGPIARLTRSFFGITDKKMTRDFKINWGPKDTEEHKWAISKFKVKSTNIIEVAVPYVCDAGPFFRLHIIKNFDWTGEKGLFGAVKQHTTISELLPKNPKLADRLRNRIGDESGNLEHYSRKFKLAIKVTIGLSSGPIFCGNQGTEPHFLGPLRIGFDFGISNKVPILPALMKIHPLTAVTLAQVLDTACKFVPDICKIFGESYIDIMGGLRHAPVYIPLDGSDVQGLDAISAILKLKLGLELSLEKLFYLQLEFTFQPELVWGLRERAGVLGFRAIVETVAKVVVTNLWASDFRTEHVLLSTLPPGQFPEEDDIDEAIRQGITEVMNDGVMISADAEELDFFNSDPFLRSISSLSDNAVAAGVDQGGAPPRGWSSPEYAAAIASQIALSLKDAPYIPDYSYLTTTITQSSSNRYGLLGMMLSAGLFMSNSITRVNNLQPSFRLIPPMGKGDPEYARFMASEVPAAFAQNHALALPARIGASAIVTDVLVSRVFTYSQPSIAHDSVSGRTIMVWSHDRSDGPVGGSRELMYSVWDGIRWSQARLITRDDLPDDMPSVVWSADGKAVLVWVRAAQRLSDQLDLSFFEIATAEYDPATDTWSSIKMLTKNNSPDLSPVVVRGEDGEVILAWLTLDVLNGNIIQSRLRNGEMRWGPVEIAWRDAPTAFDLAYYRDGNAVLIGTKSVILTGLITETLQVFVVRRREGAWGRPEQITQSPVNHEVPVVVYAADGTPIIGWIAQERIFLQGLGYTSEVVSSYQPFNIVLFSPSSFDLIRAPNGSFFMLIKSSDIPRGLYFYSFDMRDEFRSLGNPKRLNNAMDGVLGSHAIVDADGRLLVGYVQMRNQLVTRTLPYSQPVVITDIAPIQADLATLAYYPGRRLSLVADWAPDYDLVDDKAFITVTVAINNQGDVVENTSERRLNVAFFADDVLVGISPVMTMVLPGSVAFVSHTLVLTPPFPSTLSARILPLNTVLLDPGSVQIPLEFLSIKPVPRYIEDIRYSLAQDVKRAELSVVLENMSTFTTSAVVMTVTLSQESIVRMQSITVTPLSPLSQQGITTVLDLSGLKAGQYLLTVALDGQSPLTAVQSMPGDLLLESVIATDLSRAPVIIEAQIRNNGWLTVDQVSLVVEDRSRANDDLLSREVISMPVGSLAPQESLSLTLLVTQPLICELRLSVRSPLIEDVNPSDNTFMKPGIDLCFVANMDSASPPTETMMGIQSANSGRELSSWTGVAPFTVYVSNTSNHPTAAWLWDFGDGITNTQRDPVSHTYTAAGVYTLRLTVIDPDSGAQSTASRLVLVYSPTVPVIGCVGCGSATTRTDLEFFDDSEGIIEDVYWNFGDGSITQTGNLVYHTYERPGTYTVTLFVKGLEGDWRQTQMPVIVKDETDYLTYRAFLPIVGLRARSERPKHHVYLPVVHRGQR